MTSSPRSFDLQAALEASREALPPVGKHAATVTDARVSKKTDATWIILTFTIETSPDGGEDATFRKPTASDILCVDADPKGRFAPRIASGLKRAATLAELNGRDPTSWGDAEDIASDVIGASCIITIAHAEDQDGLPAAKVRAIHPPKT